MEFLKRELERLPDELVKTVVSQLESAIRAAQHASALDGKDYSVQCMAVVARIRAILDIANAFAKQLEQKE